MDILSKWAVVWKTPFLRYSDGVPLIRVFKLFSKCYVKKKRGGWWFRLFWVWIYVVNWKWNVVGEHAMFHNCAQVASETSFLAFKNTNVDSTLSWVTKSKKKKWCLRKRDLKRRRSGMWSPTSIMIPISGAGTIIFWVGGGGIIRYEWGLIINFL